MNLYTVQQKRQMLEEVLDTETFSHEERMVQDECIRALMQDILNNTTEYEQLEAALKDATIEYNSHYGT